MQNLKYISDRLHALEEELKRLQADMKLLMADSQNMNKRVADLEIKSMNGYIDPDAVTPVDELVDIDKEKKIHKTIG